MQKITIPLALAAVAVMLGACAGQARVQTAGTTAPPPDYKPSPTYVEPVITDADIRLAVDQRLSQMRDTRDVRFHVHDGVVHLEGHVHSPQSKRRIEQAVLTLDGVEHIDSADLTVLREPRRRGPPPHAEPPPHVRY